MIHVSIIMFALVVHLGSTVQVQANKTKLTGNWYQTLGQVMYQDPNLQSPCGLVWQPHSGVYEVPYAVYAGEGVAVARVLDNEGKLKPGKFVTGYGMYASAGDKEEGWTNFQVLTNPRGVQIEWAIPSSTAWIPSTAPMAGFVDDKPVYIGAVYVQGKSVSGYVLPGPSSRLWYGLDGIGYWSSQYNMLLTPNC